jgi:hypothetical protein
MSTIRGIADCTHSTSDGRYGIPEGKPGELWRLAGEDSYHAGDIMDPKNIESAADAAEEEMACLLASALEEFR